jgi:hypothetical protein
MGKEIYQVCLEQRQKAVLGAIIPGDKEGD